MMRSFLVNILHLLSIIVVAEEGRQFRGGA